MYAEATFLNLYDFFRCFVNFVSYWKLRAKTLFCYEQRLS